MKEKMEKTMEIRDKTQIENEIRVKKINIKKY